MRLCPKCQKAHKGPCHKAPTAKQVMQDTARFTKGCLKAFKTAEKSKLHFGETSD